MSVSDPIRIDVLVCTYKRPDYLRATLRGIEAAAVPPMAVRVIVVDNDRAESARPVVEGAAANSALAYEYICQPVQNISITRNCALDRADADFFALVDDDEVPDPVWLERLVDAAIRFDADIVFGPVLPVYEPGVPNWVIRGGFFPTYDVDHETGAPTPINAMASGNVLLRGKAYLRHRRKFDPALGLCGGEDAVFFAQLQRDGLKNVWCSEAVAREWVPLTRGTVRWLVLRRFRIGSVIAHKAIRNGDWPGLLLACLKASVFAVQGSLAACVGLAISKAACVKGLQRLSLGAGIFYGSIAGPYREYRTAGIDQGEVKHGPGA